MMTYMNMCVFMYVYVYCMCSRPVVPVHTKKYLLKTLGLHRPHTAGRQG